MFGCVGRVDDIGLLNTSLINGLQTLTLIFNLDYAFCQDQALWPKILSQKPVVNFKKVKWTEFLLLPSATFY